MKVVGRNQMIAGLRSAVSYLQRQHDDELENTCPRTADGNLRLAGMDKLAKPYMKERASLLNKLRLALNDPECAPPRYNRRGERRTEDTV